MKTNYKKFFRELKIYKGRTFMALIGVLIGIFSIGFVLSAYAILLREMDRNFMNTNPASIIMKVKNLDDNGLKLINEMDMNIDVEARKTLLARINRENGTYGTIYLFAVEDFKNLRIDTFTLENGEFPQNPNQIAIERDSLKNLSNIKKGYDENAFIMLPGGREVEMSLSGKVHAPGLSPASMEKYSYGFLTIEGLQALGYQGWYDEIRCVSYDNRFDRKTLKTLAEDMKELLEQNGYIIEKYDVPEPGKHPHGDQLESLLFLLQAFTVISLLVACIIIINLLNSIMSTQTKQIAIMKATGANTWDIAIPYFLYVLIISACAIIISIPIAVWAGTAYSDFAADVLNFKITSYTIPFWVFAVQVLSGIIVPLIASFYPIYRSCKITVKEGLAEQIINKNDVKEKMSLIQRLINKSNTKTKIPINNIFRKKGRTILAILALAAGGIIFMTAQNIVASIDKTVEASMNTFGYDYELKLYGQYSNDEIVNALSKIEGVDNVEVYKASVATLKNPDGLDTTHYTIKAIATDSEMINFQLISGELNSNLENSIIINQALLDSEAWLRVGMQIEIEIEGKSEMVTVAGIVNEVPPIPIIYMNSDNYESDYSGNYKQNVFITTENLNTEEQLRVSKLIEENLRESGIAIAENWNISLLRKSFVEHLKVIINFLSVVALLAVAVGGLSIASAIGISISERKREIGIFRAIGANSNQTFSMISLEVILMGIAGWLIGLILAYPISIWAGNYFGQIALHSDLDNTLSISGLLVWLSISVSISFLSGFIPARKAVKSSLGEMLSYE